jgi:divalent metal cation (Fe/Co/Zn/Cd) transporter
MLSFDVMAATAELDRSALARRGRRLEYFTIVWSCLEGLVGVAAGAMAGSISLMAFGIDSFIEVTSGGAVLWRMKSDADLARREKTEKIALRIVGFCFLGLAVYVTWQALADLLGRDAPERSIPGIVLAAASVIVMPLLARAKGRVGRQMGSAAMAADAKQSLFCLYFSATLLAGLLLNATLGLWWADPVAALIMVPMIAREGVEAIQGKTCDD